MLFKVLDRDDKFIQYISLCMKSSPPVAPQAFDISEMVRVALANSGVLRKSQFMHCTYNYNFCYKEAIDIKVYAGNYAPPDGRVIFSLIEMLSDKRKKEILANLNSLLYINTNTNTNFLVYDRTTAYITPAYITPIILHDI